MAARQEADTLRKGAYLSAMRCAGAVLLTSPSPLCRAEQPQPHELEGMA